MPRFIHTADWQIGKQFGQLATGEAAVLSEQRIDTVAAIGELATRRKVDAVLVAGDVFDVQAISSRTFHRLAKAMEAFAGPWVLLPGNHDAALAESVWEQWRRTVELPPNIHLALAADVIELAEAGLAVLCAPLTQRHSQQDLTEPFGTWESADALVRVGLAHGSIHGLLPDEMEIHNPIAPERAERARLDYLALGDWHGKLIVNPRTAYSGTPETDGFRNNDSGNVLEVTIEHPGAEPGIEVHPSTHYRWHELHCRITVREDLERFREQCQSLDRRSVVKLHLEGNLDLEAERTVRGWTEELEAQVHALLLDDRALTLNPSESDIAGLRADGYLADVVDELAVEQESDEVSREALRLLLQKLATRQKNLTS